MLCQAHWWTKSMAQCTAAVTPLLTHWSYCSLTLSHRNTHLTPITQLQHDNPIMTSLTHWSYGMAVVIAWILANMLRCFGKNVSFVFKHFRGNPNYRRKIVNTIQEITRWKQNHDSFVFLYHQMTFDKSEFWKKNHRARFLSSIFTGSHDDSK